MCVCASQIAGDIKGAKRDLKKARTVLQMDELKCRKRVLRRLGFATSCDVIEMKGRVACEISRSGRPSRTNRFWWDRPNRGL